MELPMELPIPIKFHWKHILNITDQLFHFLINCPISEPIIKENHIITINTLQLCAHTEIPVVPITSQQCFICEICRKLYKTKRKLVCHQNIVKKYNIGHEELYTLSLEAINQFKADLVYVIGTRLKEYFKHSRK
ncbi:hypothetical protein Glove_73g29 [Diversispora epigaea]|uniref:C2H2-type domain-containing protein n=1 Tax=Diversispora epigaea TaxID=1348612 RepID=A0A397JAK0_9GLOM|nr:hypothetical protein Glove_73g29 [Diversispora epigaea]